MVCGNCFFGSGGEHQSLLWFCLLLIWRLPRLVLANTDCLWRFSITALNLTCVFRREVSVKTPSRQKSLNRSYCIGVIPDAKYPSIKRWFTMNSLSSPESGAEKFYCSLCFFLQTNDKLRTWPRYFIFCNVNGYPHLCECSAKSCNSLKRLSHWPMKFSRAFEAGSIGSNSRFSRLIHKICGDYKSHIWINVIIHNQ